MRLAFLIRRQNHYRLLGPVIDRALARGWDVECWEATDEAAKSSQASGPPTFRHGHPRRLGYRVDELGRLLAERRPDVFVTQYRPEGVEPDGRVRWLGVQYTLNVGMLLDATGATPFDAIALSTEHWRAHTAEAVRIFVFNRGGEPDSVDRGAVDATVHRRGVVVGFPEMDQLHLIDRAAVRRRLRLEGRPMVLYCPYPFLSNPRTFWTDNVYGPFRSSPYAAKLEALVPGAGRLIDAAGRVRQRRAARRRTARRYTRDVARGWDDRGVARAVRAFCDANRAALVVKPRAKDPVPGYLRAVADRVIDHETDYPATILELMSVAALCVHFFSTVAYEAAYAGVPSICVTAEAEDLGFPPVWREWFLSDEPGSSFNFPGVTYALPVGAMVEDLERRPLADFALEPAARAQYVEQYVGADDGKASERVLEAAAALVENGR